MEPPARFTFTLLVPHHQRSNMRGSLVYAPEVKIEKATNPLLLQPLAWLSTPPAQALERGVDGSCPASLLQLPPQLGPCPHHTAETKAARAPPAKPVESSPCLSAWTSLRGSLQ